MPISFICPHCGKHTNVSAEFAGMTGPCVNCGKQVTVPLLPGMSETEGLPNAPSGGSRTAAWILGTIGIVTLFSCFICMGVGLTMPAIQAARESARRVQCQNNLREIGIALTQYNIDHGCFPPAYIADDQGNRLHSWRALLLPYLDEELAEQYDFNQPWDSDHNYALAYRMPSVYACPSDPDTYRAFTSYVASDGENRFFQGDRPVTADEIVDGLQHTIAVIEDSNSGITWIEPRDRDEDYEVTDFDSVFYSNHPNGSNVLYADGSVDFLNHDIDPQVLAELEVINDTAGTAEAPGKTASTPDSTIADDSEALQSVDEAQNDSSTQLP